MVLTSLAPLYATEAAKILKLSIDLSTLLNLAWLIGFLGPFSLTVLRLRRGSYRYFFALISLAFLPVLLVTLFSVSVRNIFFDRLFLPSTLGVALLLAWSLTDVFDLFSKQNHRAFVSLFLASLALGLSCLSLAVYYRLDRKEDFRSATSFLISRCRSNDVILFVTHAGEALFNWYEGNRLTTVRRYGIPYGYEERPNQSSGHVIRHSYEVERIGELCSGAKRIWLVRLRTQYHDPQEFTYRWMEDHLRRLGEYPFSGVQVSLYAQRSDNGS